ncbi:hypothetical protein [Sphingobacterium sp. SGR-19]|uniref:hypothetical protein n=1 Tax=Sphingobacterium sp. SGR-19 TaxID=2710886 RepID=UPI0013EBB2AC|nr:hypothetical protein [Sphingobacterium sp. SGR-19]NGM65432.1 hypothetical protein [Sphingobacterium sp. SGR-19]
MDNLKEEHTFDLIKAESDRELILHMEVDLSTPEEPKIKQLFAHEIGHLVGLLINNILTEQFGNPKRISFRKGDAIFEYDWIDNIFQVLSYNIEKDYYGHSGRKINEFCKECQQTQNYINKSYNLERLTPYISYLLLGGLFHLYFDAKLKGYKVQEYHFDKIFSDENDDNVSSIVGAAGSDWTSVRMYCGEYRIPNEILLEYRQQLYNICLATGLFSHFEEEIDNLIEKGKMEYKGEDMEELLNRLSLSFKDYLSENDFLKQLDNLNHLIRDRI